ncbi:MAG: PAS domain S-box protein [Candidatus Atribacteria bacterium]|nr:PAS domain S-box protein [Candidatus Atribacteria bacterium]
MDSEKLGNKENKAKEKDLNYKKNNYFKYLFDYSPDFQVILNNKGKIIRVNKVFKEITGKKKRELIGNLIDEFIPEFKKIMTELRDKRIKKKRVTDIEISVNRPGREPLFCELICMAFINKEGEKIIHLSGRDITERKRLQLNLLETDEKLEKKVTKSAKKLKKARSKLNQLKKLSIIGQSVINVAHEIRNPLTTINLIVQYLESIPADNYHAEQLQSIQRNLKRIDKIVFSLLHLFQTSGFNFSYCNVNGIFERLNSTLGHSFPRNIKIVEKYGSNIPQGWFDSACLEQVFLNIIFNAIQAMPKGGELYITTSFDPAKNVIMIEFKDTGIGIPEENLKKILKPYFTTFKGGTGLGLTISRNIVRKHKGTMSIDSKPGEGAIISICLPIKKEREKNRKRDENND